MCVLRLWLGREPKQAACGPAILRRPHHGGRVQREGGDGSAFKPARTSYQERHEGA